MLLPWDWTATSAGWSPRLTVSVYAQPNVPINCHNTNVHIWARIRHSIQILATSWTIRCSHPARINEYLSFLKYTDRLHGPHRLIFNSKWCSFTAAGRPGREADRSPTSRAEVKNEWSYKSTPLIRLHGVERDSFFILIDVQLVAPQP